MPPRGSGRKNAGNAVAPSDSRQARANRKDVILATVRLQNRVRVSPAARAILSRLETVTAELRQLVVTREYDAVEGLAGTDGDPALFWKLAATSIPRQLASLRESRQRRYPRVLRFLIAAARGMHGQMRGGHEETLYFMAILASLTTSRVVRMATGSRLARSLAMFARVTCMAHHAGVELHTSHLSSPVDLFNAVDRAVVLVATACPCCTHLQMWRA
ncbi:MAG: hypothetical protein MHM6MM_005053 [Cercozoa sp. M6MM]